MLVGGFGERREWLSVLERSVALLGVVAFLVSGCSIMDDSRYRAEGAGAELYTADSSAATSSLNSYFGELCAQADFPYEKVETKVCNTAGLSPGHWRLLVHTGFNDIDQRCDRYLGWLDVKRSDKGLFDQGIAAAGALTGGILGLAAPETKAINFVSLALGFASSTYNAYNNTILLGIESSTVKTIVITRRLDFRKAFIDAVYGSKPDAVYALRSYLRICTPQTITLDINTYSRTGVTGDRPPQVDNLAMERSTMANVPRSSEQGALQRPRPPVPTPDPLAAIFEGPGFGKTELRTLQSAFCLQNDGLGQVGPRTRAGVIMWEDLQYADKPDTLLNNKRINRDEFGLIQGLNRGVPCDASKWKNVYENSQFGSNPISVETFLRALNIGFADNPVDEKTGLGGRGVRDKIAIAQAACRTGNFDGAAAGEVTRSLRDRVIAWSRVANREGKSCGTP